MRTRVISGAALVAVIAGALIGGDQTVFLLCLLIGFIGMFELYRVVGIEKSPVGVTGYLLAAAYYGLLYTRNEIRYFELFVAFTAILIMAVYVCTFAKIKANQAAFAVLAIFYVVIPSSFLFKIMHLRDGIYIFILIFICSWIADTFAYFTGVTLGKHKLVPVLSPKKSVEGAIGGVLGAALVAGVYGYFVGGHLHRPGLFLVFALTGLVGSIISIFGDLAASAIKRNYDVKDYSRLIPGHGGILDRFDSMIFVAPVVYAFAHILL